jgi:NAD(P)-dependent dehydrogenase (short-subunit alcohol dehydrogenase family)
MRSSSPRENTTLLSLNMSSALKLAFPPAYTKNSERPVAIVIGGTGSVGQEIARHLYSLGFSLVLLARNADRLQEFRNVLLTKGDVSKCNALYDTSLFWHASGEQVRAAHLGLT